MSGRRAFETLTKNFTPERRACVEAKKAKFRAALLRHELRPPLHDSDKGPGHGRPPLPNPLPPGERG